MSTATDTTQKPTAVFLTKLYEKMKELVGDKLSQDDFNSAVKFARSHAGGTAKAQKSQLEATEMSLTRRIEMINAALSEAFKRPFSGESWFYWAREIFDDYVIVSSTEDGKYYQVPYAIDGDDVTFGEPVEVEQTFAPVNAGEGIDLIDLCADGHGVRLFNELQDYAEPPEWIPYLPKPGKYTSPKYGEINITSERIETFVKNFDDHVYQEKLPIDAEHETKLSGALGWITQMRVNDDGSVDARAEWTDRGVTLIEADRFKYFSPEWFEEWTDPATEEKHSDVAVGGALTTRPFFKEKALRPLVASERGLEATETDPKDLPTTQTVIFTALAPVTKEKAMSTVATDDKTGADKEPVQLAEAQKFAEMERKLADTEAALRASEAESQKLSERTATLEKEGRTKRFTDTIRDADGNGTRRFIGEEAKHLEFMEKLSEAFGETSDEVKHYVTDQQAHAEQVRQSDLFKEVGRTGAGGDENPAEAQLEAKAKALQAAETSLTYAQAYDRVMTDNPELVQRQRAESRGGK